MLSGLEMNLTESSPSATHNGSCANALLLLPVPQLHYHQSEGLAEVGKQMAKTRVGLNHQPARKKTLTVFYSQIAVENRI